LGNKKNVLKEQKNVPKEQKNELGEQIFVLKAFIVFLPSWPHKGGEGGKCLPCPSKTNWPPWHLDHGRE